EFVQQVAGSEFNPYVIKDGVDLLGLSALVTGGAYETSIDFDNKYIEFANGVNNLAGDVSSSIQMPVRRANYTSDGRIPDYVFNGSQKGKSYHLYDRAANGLHVVKLLCGDEFSKNDSSLNMSGNDVPATSIHATAQNASATFTHGTTTYDLWYDMHCIYSVPDKKYVACNEIKEYYDNGELALKGNNAHNFNPIGYRGTIENGASKHAFKGNITGAYYVEITDGKERQNALDNGTGYVYIKDKYVLYNKNSRDHKKYIEDGGKVYEVRQTEILDLEVRGGYITAVGSGNSAIKDSYAGLFGLVEDANISYITVTGTATAYGEDGSTSQAGIVAKAYGDTKLTSLQAGVTSGASENRFVVRTASGTSGYVGGIVGYADSGATGNRLTISDCVITNADISTHKIPFATAADIFKIGAGGIVGYTQGDNITSYTDITDCHVVKAYIHSPNGFAVAGIVGNQGLKGALAVSDCIVGTKGAQYSETLDANNKFKSVKTGVRIEGMAAIGGIVSYAFALDTCSNSYIDCYVYEDVLIRRTDRHIDEETKKETDSMTIAQYGAALGGIVGAVTDQAGKATFNGEIEFYGTIDLGNNTNNKNVGGAVGYMGTSAKINSGCVIRIGGTIKSGTENTVEDNNIGGFAGVSSGAILDGTFYIYPQMVTATCNNVGGFIGNNQGKTEIARTATIQTFFDANGDGKFNPDETTNPNETANPIEGNKNVGGFIGKNTEGNEVVIGIAQSGAESFGAGTAQILLGASVDGKGNLGGLVGGNYGKITTQECVVVNDGAVGGKSLGSTGSFIQCVGGFIGYVGPQGNVVIEKHDDSSITNNGVVGNTSYKTAYQEYVGGVIGASYGSIDIKGNIANQGQVYGYRYVGGVIGVVGSGTISGTLNNGTEASETVNAGSSEAESAEDDEEEGIVGATVTAVQSVGGIIGAVMENATLDGAILANYGKVTANSEGIDGINNVSNLGGVIGLHYGIITGSIFYNNGQISAENFAGGVIGVSAGTITATEDSTYELSLIINHATLNFTGDTALGGAVGYITTDYNAYYPGGRTEAKNASIVSNSYFSYEPVNSQGLGGERVTVQATGETRYDATDATARATAGGLGGVFGVIDSEDITDENGWKNNTFFIHGNVIGGKVDANGEFVQGSGTVDGVGGVVGIIDGAYITIKDMLVYKSTIAGNQYVGGMVGSNGSINALAGAGASIDNCYNLYGKVWATGRNEAGGIVGHVEGNAKTYASYWVKDEMNEFIKNSSPDDISATINTAGNWTPFLSSRDYNNGTDIKDKDPANLTEEELKTIEKEFGGSVEAYFATTGCLRTECPTWDDYFEQHPEYVKNNVGDWGTRGEQVVNYNTGNPDGSTGYYYIYASDAVTFAGEDKSIAVDH
ncbi:MAG: hypothetical protein J6U74_06335, partial [Clostridia bacterium]|nr:hypothetical protein [Clostridia bacterium]